MDSRLAAKAAVQGGYFTRADVFDSGYDDRDIRAAVRVGEWIRVRAGVYAPGDVWRTLSAEERHQISTCAVVDRLGPDRVAVSHASACAKRGFALWDVDLTKVHVTRLDGGTGRNEYGVVHHVGDAVGERDLDLIDGRLYTRPLRCVWETSMDVSQRSGLVLMDSALRLGGVDREELECGATMFRSWQGSRHVGLVVRLADGDAESPGESLTRFVCFRFNLPKPTLQHEVFDDSGRLLARTDFAWLEYAHVAEFDGKIKYGRLLRPGETAGNAVVREKRREDRVRARALGMSRFIFGDVMPRQERHSADRLWSDLQQSRRLYLHNRTVIAVS
ncbi:MAG: type IV toxin-antitoxin system AbiEi family antitoxin domain-containing protein [Nocardioidaceae bacterium]